MYDGVWQFNTREVSPSNIDTSHLERGMAPLKHDRESQPDPTGYACEAIEHYAAALLLSSRHVFHALLRAVTTWFHNENAPQIQSAAVNLLGPTLVPSAKIVLPIPPFTARLCDPTAPPETIETIKKTLTRLPIDHPHHTLVALAAVSKATFSRQGGQTPVWAVQENLDRVSQRRRSGCAGVRRVHRADAPARHGTGPQDITWNLDATEAAADVSERLSPHLQPPGRPERYLHHFPYVQGFDQRIELMKGITRPRRVVCFGGNGQRYIQLIKGKDPPRQDATTVQLFDLLNELFARRALTHHLHILSFWPTCVCLVAAVREHCDPITIVLEVFVVRSFKRGKATQQAITPGALSWLA